MGRRLLSSGAPRTRTGTSRQHLSGLFGARLTGAVRPDQSGESATAATRASKYAMLKSTLLHSIPKSIGPGGGSEDADQRDELCVDARRRSRCSSDAGADSSANGGL